MATDFTWDNLTAVEIAENLKKVAALSSVKSDSMRISRNIVEKVGFFKMKRACQLADLKLELI
jgi:ribosomal protein S13